MSRRLDTRPTALATRHLSPAIYTAESCMFWQRKLVIPVEKLVIPVEKLVVPVEKLIVLARNVPASLAPRFTHQSSPQKPVIFRTFARLLRTCMNAGRKKAHLTRPLVLRKPSSSRHMVRKRLPDWEESRA